MLTCTPRVLATTCGGGRALANRTEKTDWTRITPLKEKTEEKSHILLSFVSFFNHITRFFKHLDLFRMHITKKRSNIHSSVM